jgi:hypothetical protein
MTPARRPRGRPSKLASRITIPEIKDPSGTVSAPERTITCADRIYELMEARGTRAELCAREIGLERKSVESWLRHGSRAEEKRAKSLPLTPQERAYLDFLLNTRAAHQRWIHSRLEVHGQIAAGGLVIGEITETVDPTRTTEDGKPVVLERKVKQRKALPDTKAIEWELERLARDEEGDRMFSPRVEVTGADGGPIETESREDREERLASELRAYQQGLADQQAREAELA